MMRRQGVTHGVRPAFTGLEHRCRPEAARQRYARASSTPGRVVSASPTTPSSSR
jgi:hypothetical protein